MANTRESVLNNCSFPVNSEGKIDSLDKIVVDHQALVY